MRIMRGLKLYHLSHRSLKRIDIFHFSSTNVNASISINLGTFPTSYNTSMIPTRTTTSGAEAGIGRWVHIYDHSLEKLFPSFLTGQKLINYIQNQSIIYKCTNRKTVKHGNHRKTQTHLVMLSYHSVTGCELDLISMASHTRPDSSAFGPHSIQNTEKGFSMDGLHS